MSVSVDVDIRYRLGLPAWAHAGWRRGFFAASDEPLLRQYSSVYRAVEGNTTFYQVPTVNTVAQWRAQLQGRDCVVCFKLPREATHGRALNSAGLTEFFSRLEPLGSHLGPFLLQFSRKVDRSRLNELRTFLHGLPRAFRYVLELRHPEFFAGGAAQRELTDLVSETGCGRAMMDARSIFLDSPGQTPGTEHPDVQTARHEKPDLPVQPELINNLAMVRLVCHPDEGRNHPFWDAWFSVIADWQNRGCEPIVIVHCPNDDHCPRFAELLHERFRKDRPQMAALPDWPRNAASGQLGLL